MVSALEKVSHIAIPGLGELNIKALNLLTDSIDVDKENTILETFQLALTGSALLPTPAELTLSTSVTMITTLVEELITVGH